MCQLIISYYVVPGLWKHGMHLIIYKHCNLGELDGVKQIITRKTVFHPSTVKIPMEDTSDNTRINTGLNSYLFICSKWKVHPIQKGLH